LGVCVWLRAAARRASPPLQRYDELKAELIRCERHMLREYGFLAAVEHPHKLVLNFCQLLELPPALRQQAWNHANDSLRTTLCVRFPAEAVACGCIHLAARAAEHPLPEGPPAWWQLFGAAASDVPAVARVLLALLAQPRARYVHVGPLPVGGTPPPSPPRRLPSPPRRPPPPPQPPQHHQQPLGRGGEERRRERGRSRSPERGRGRERRRSRSRSRSRDRRRRSRSRSRSRSRGRR